MKLMTILMLGLFLSGCMGVSCITTRNDTGGTTCDTYYFSSTCPVNTQPVESCP